MDVSASSERDKSTSRAALSLHKGVEDSQDFPKSFVLGVVILEKEKRLIMEERQRIC